MQRKKKKKENVQTLKARFRAYQNFPNILNTLYPRRNKYIIYLDLTNYVNVLGRLQFYNALIAY